MTAVNGMMDEREMIYGLHSTIPIRFRYICLTYFGSYILCYGCYIICFGHNRLVARLFDAKAIPQGCVTICAPMSWCILS